MCIRDRHTVPVVLARHRLAPAGAGVMVRDHGHVRALETAAMAAATGAAPHRRKVRIPPGPDAEAAAQALRDHLPSTSTSPSPGAPAEDAPTDAGALVIDLA